jgi:hypothetical protein
MKTFEDAWRDIQAILSQRQQVETICQKSVNDIVEVDFSGIRVSSHRSRSGKVRFISKDEFKYVWDILSEKDVHTLASLQKIIGKRSITCAILAKLPYVAAKCDKGKVSLGFTT